MPAWGDLLNEFNALPEADKGPWITKQTTEQLQAISKLRGGRHVLLYASAFMQKPGVPGLFTQITHEDINGFMATMHGMDWDRGLTLILHTPGGVTNAAESIISYLHSKFPDIETIVPTFAMSAGTMISLGTNRLIMGRPSQLGPIDPQLPVGNRLVSARAIVDQFERAQNDVARDIKLAHVWAPILQTLGPALLVESENALAYGETMVARWLQTRMFAGHPNKDDLAKSVAHHFNDAKKHQSHGRRIDRDEVRGQGIAVEDLEANQDLQEAVLSAYHVLTIFFESSPGVKAMLSDHGKVWIKNAGAM